MCNCLMDRIDTLIGLVDSVLEEKQIVSNLHPKCRRAIACSHLFASILKDYLQHEQHTCPFMPKHLQSTLATDLLELVCVRGGCTRDTLLDRPINDIDCLVDCNKTMIYHLNHLKMYHSHTSQQSKDCKCILFQRYLNKYKNINALKQYCKDINTNSELNRRFENLKQEYSFFDSMHRCVESDYVLNSRFFVQILIESSILKDKIKITPMFFNENLNIKITQSLVYQNVELNGVECDLCPTTVPVGSVSSVVDCSQYETKNETAEKVLIKETECNVMDFSFDFDMFPIDLEKCIICHDFTIGCIYMTFLDILQDDYDYDAYDGIQSIDFHWKYKIYSTAKKNGNIERISHLKNKLLVAPSLEIITKKSATFYFWRLVKIVAKFIIQIENNIWNIDEQLIEHTISLYPEWFTTDFINNNYERGKWMVSKFLSWGVKQDTRIKEYENRFKVFKMIKFDNLLINALIENASFRKHWRFVIHRGIKCSQTKQLVWELFDRWGYSLTK